MTPSFKTAALVGRYQSEGVADALTAIAGFLRERGLRVLLESDTAAAIGCADIEHADPEQIGREADIAIAVGGDGTMLGIARQLARHGVPLVGINHGRLGFITDISLEFWRDALAQVLQGHYSAEQRSLLTAEVIRGEQVIWQNLALNDVIVSRSSRAGMIELQVEVDGLYMYSQRADGLVVATPTGSTAYALSANGPILHPRVSGIVLVPVAPQALSNRPIVLPDDVAVSIRVVEGREPRLACDMQAFSDLQIGDDIIVRKAAFTVRFLHPPGYSYYATLRNKLNWHELPILRRSDS
jgi:NAD+ kinase